MRHFHLVLQILTHPFIVSGPGHGLARGIPVVLRLQFQVQRLALGFGCPNRISQVLGEIKKSMGYLWDIYGICIYTACDVHKARGSFCSESWKIIDEFLLRREMYS